MRRVIGILLILIVVIMIVLAAFLIQQQQKQEGGQATATPTGVSTIVGMLHAQGALLVDAEGHPFLLHGAQIESPFNVKKRWDSGEDPRNVLNSKTFTAMAREWHMNEVRLPTSNWLYAADPTKYVGLLDQVVQKANRAGLIVVLDLHDDNRSGSPYPPGTDMPKAEDVAYWQAIARHFRDNPMVMFDLYNEPHYTDPLLWLQGGRVINGATIVGMQDMVDAIRAVGAKQVIVVSGVESSGNAHIHDPNIMYTQHIYHDLELDSPQQWDAKWGPNLGHYPLYYGEWAVLPNSLQPVHCEGMTPENAARIVRDFLNYTESHHISWNAWQFTPYHLIQNFTTFAPTTLDGSWTCGDSSSHAGMGEIIMQYLSSYS